MRLESVHPSVIVEKVKDETGFELIMPSQVPATVPPTSEELSILKEIVDPTGSFLGRRMKG